jgi:hypothetical protein
MARYRGRLDASGEPSRQDLLGRGLAAPIGRVGFVAMALVTGHLVQRSRSGLSIRGAGDDLLARLRFVHLGTLELDQ